MLEQRAHACDELIVDTIDPFAPHDGATEGPIYDFTELTPVVRPLAPDRASRVFAYNFRAATGCTYWELGTADQWQYVLAQDAYLAACARLCSPKDVEDFRRRERHDAAEALLQLRRLRVARRHGFPTSGGRRRLDGARRRGNARRSHARASARSSARSGDSGSDGPPGEPEPASALAPGRHHAGRPA